MMIQLLSDYPLLLLFVVTAVGYPLGRLEVAWFRFGPVRVLAQRGRKPAVLSFAKEQTGNGRANLGYATYPLVKLSRILMLSKILFAQPLLLVP